MKKRIRRFTIFAIAFSLLLSGSIYLKSASVDAKIRISSTSKTILVGESEKLSMKGTSKKVKWSSSDKKIAKVSKKGIVTALSKGKVTITAKVAGKSFKCKVKVEQPALSNISLSLIEGDSVVISVKGTTKKVQWSSSNTAVATVDNGRVTAVSEGTANITAKVSKQKLSCVVKVTAAPGTFNNPLSAFDEFTHELYEGDERLGIFKFKLLRYEEGDSVIKLMDSSRKEYTNPGSGQTYVYMEFSLSYLNGERGVKANKIFKFKENFYNSSKNKLVDNILYVKEVNYTKDSDDIILYPSGVSPFTKTILVNKKDIPMTYKIQTGYDRDNKMPVYTWFKIQ